MHNFYVNGNESPSKRQNRLDQAYWSDLEELRNHMERDWNELFDCQENLIDNDVLL